MMPKYVVLTGAGISAESGIKTFRDSNGLWEGHRIEDVATPEGFHRNPTAVYEFYNQRRAQLLSAEVHPNPAHQALADLARDLDGDLILITQNVDDLHERAGHKNVKHMHGELLKARCMKCEAVYELCASFDAKTPCAHCCAVNSLRPDIVWFGEMPFFMPEIEAYLTKCRYFISIGTSGHVYPAAGFVEMAKYAGAECTELNLEASQNAAAFDIGIYGAAGETVPKWCAEIREKENAR